MDESWDANFEGDLKVPEGVRAASDSVKAETQAAKQLAHVTGELRALLLRNPPADHSLLVRAMAIVHASVIDSNDEIYKSPVWESCRDSTLEVAGDSIEDVLHEAQSIESKLSQVCN